MRFRIRFPSLAQPYTPERATSRIDRFMLLGAGLMTLALAALLLRVANLQLAPNAALKAAVQQRTSHRTVPSMRGDLLDRRGRLLATTRLGYRVFVDPTQLPDPPDEAIVALAEAIDSSVDQIGERIITRVAANAAVLAGRPREPEKTNADIRAELLEGVLRKLGLAHDERPESLEGVSERDLLKGLVRYVRVSDILNDEQAERVRALKIPGVHLERRSVREYPVDDVAASIIGKVSVDHEGLIGAERKLDGDLTGEDGRVGYVRDAFGRPLWIEVGHVRPAQRGLDIRLSIDVELQRIALEELERGVEESDAVGGRLIMLDPRTGEILAMLDIVREVPGLARFPWAPKDAAHPPIDPGAPGRRYRALAEDPGRRIHPALARNRCVEDVYEPGSTFKPFVWAAVTELGLARAGEVFDTEGGRWRTAYGRSIEDVVKRAYMTWEEVLVNSSNVGMVKASERLNPAQFSAAVERFGFGSRTGIGLPGESPGIVTPLRAWTKYTHTSMAFGHEIAVTPIQMVRAFSAFARTGELAGTVVPVRLTASDGGTESGVVRRVIPANVAILAREAMAGVVENLDRKLAGKKEAGWRYTMFGKSGTAEIPLGKAPPGYRRPRGSSGYYDDQYNASFVAGGPVEDPRLVILCVIDDPGPERIRRREHYGSSTAGPVVRRVMERSLTYLGVPAATRPALDRLAATAP